MTGMDVTTARTAGERLIEPLLPAKPTRPAPIPVPLPALPTPPRSPAELLIDAATPDGSGRISARRLLHLLGWQPGHRIDLAVMGGLLVIGSGPTASR